MQMLWLKKNALFLFVLVACGSLQLSAQDITTLADGAAKYGFAGDGGPALYAEFYLPAGLFLDNRGNLFVADHFNNRIRKIDASGFVSTIAGTGKLSSNGDGGAATKAALGIPVSVTGDRNGNIFFTDVRTYRVRKVDKNGIITAFAGSGKGGFSGDGDSAVKATFNGVSGLATDSAGNVYIVDANNYRIRKVDVTTGIVTTIAGIGGPHTTHDIGDGGPATAAILVGPSCLAFDYSGNLYVGDGGSSIRKIDKNGIITTVVGGATPGDMGDGGPATSARINVPNGIAFDGHNNMYIAEGAFSYLRKVDTNGIISTVAGTGRIGHTGDGGPAKSAELYVPLAVAVDSSGGLYVSCDDNSIRFICSKIDSTHPVKIFPNPTKGVFQIILSSVHEENVSIAITSMSGKKTMEIVAPTNKLIDINIENTGVYTIGGVSTHGKWRGEVSVIR